MITTETRNLKNESTRRVDEIRRASRNERQPAMMRAIDRKSSQPNGHERYLLDNWTEMEIGDPRAVSNSLTYSPVLRRFSVRTHVAIVKLIQLGLLATVEWYDGAITRESIIKV